MSLFDDLEGRETKLMKSNRLNVLVKLKPHVVNSSSSNIKVLENGTDLQINNTEKYTFNSVVTADLDQKTFFTRWMREKIQDFFLGENQYIFTYGTSSSGKTHTLFGDSARQGLVPRSLALIFNFFRPEYDSLVQPCYLNDVVVLKPSDHTALNNLKKNLLNDSNCRVNQYDLDSEAEDENCDLDKYRYSIWISCAEIYNEKIYDNLEPLDKILTRKPKDIRTDRAGFIFIKDLTWIPVQDLEETLGLISVAKQRQHIAATKLNQQSSRSHSIFTIKVIRRSRLEERGLKSIRVSSLVFCDMAGSERCSKAQTLDDAKRFKESASINSSLLTFGRCIQIMRNNLKNSTEKQILVPYRDSKLTRIFQSFFNGQGKATMIVTISQDSRLLDETLRTLNFASVAKEVMIESAAQTNGNAKVYGLDEDPAAEKKKKKQQMRKSLRIIRCEAMSDSTDISDQESAYTPFDDASVYNSELVSTPDRNNRLFAMLPTLERETLIGVVKKLFNELYENETKLREKLKQEERHFIQIDQIHQEYNDKIRRLHSGYKEEIEYEVAKRKRIQEAFHVNNASCSMDDSDMSLVEVLEKNNKTKCSLCQKIRKKVDPERRLSIFPASESSCTEFERIEEFVVIQTPPKIDKAKEGHFVLDESKNKCSTPTTVVRNPNYNPSDEPQTVVAPRVPPQTSNEPQSPTTKVNFNKDSQKIAQLSEENLKLAKQIEELNSKLKAKRTSDVGVQANLVAPLLKDFVEIKPKKSARKSKAKKSKESDNTVEVAKDTEETNESDSNKENVPRRTTRQTRRMNLSLKLEPEQQKTRKMLRRRKATLD